MSFRLFWRTLPACVVLMCGSILLPGRGLESEPSSAVVSAECVQVNAGVLDQIAAGRLDDAKRDVSGIIGRDVSRLGSVCAGLLLNNVGAALELSGRPEEARPFAEQAIRYFERSVPANDPAYFRSLHLLASIELEQGMTGEAREILRKMEPIRMSDPSDRVRFLCINGSLLIREERWREAETQFTGALSLLSGQGVQNSAEGAAVRTQLANVYIQEQRYREAGELSSAALAALSQTADAVPLDRIKLLNARAVAFGFQKRWKDAESDFAQAVSLARQQGGIEAVEFQPLLANYALVLRKLHRKQAKSVEASAATLRDSFVGSRQVVDLAELAAEHGR